MMKQFSGVSGQELLDVLKRAFSDYVSYRFFPPDLSKASQRVLSRSNFGNYAGIWTLAKLSDVVVAKRKCPYYAKDRFVYRSTKNFHPALKYLVEIADIIEKGY